MKFNIGPETYTVRISEDRIFQDGKECLGLAIYTSREILLSPALPPKNRLTTLLHELRHAWQMHFPGGEQNDEQEAVMSASIMHSTMRDLVMQGGARALERMVNIPAIMAAAEEQEPAEEVFEMRYVPADQVEESETPAMSRAGRAQCGRCEFIIADGSIVTSDAHWDHEAKGTTVTRQLFCPHCYAVQVWEEGANLAGVPNGAVVRGPEYVTAAAAVEEFLAGHPTAVGMITT